MRVHTRCTQQATSANPAHEGLCGESSTGFQTMGAHRSQPPDTRPKHRRRPPIVASPYSSAYGLRRRHGVPWFRLKAAGFLGSSQFFSNAPAAAAFDPRSSSKISSCFHKKQSVFACSGLRRRHWCAVVWAKSLRNGLCVVGVPAYNTWNRG